MALSKSEKLALDDLISKGDLVAAQNLLAGKTGTATVEAPSPAPPPAPPPPRKLEEIVLSLFEAIYSLFGSNPSMTPYITELRDHVTPPTPEDKQ